MHTYLFNLYFICIFNAFENGNETKEPEEMQGDMPIPLN